MSRWNAIANHRLVGFNGTQVQFRWRDYAHGNKLKTMTLSAVEFLRRYLLHTLPKGFCRIRHYGLLGNCCRRLKMAQCRVLLSQPETEPYLRESTEVMMLRLTGRDIHQCRECEEGRLRAIFHVQPARLLKQNQRVIKPP